MPGFCTPFAMLPFHQFQAVFPGLIHDASPIALGGFRFTTMFDSTNRPGSAPIISTRQGDFIGACVMTETIPASVLGSKTGAMFALVLISSTRVASRAVNIFSSATAVTYMHG